MPKKEIEAPKILFIYNDKEVIKEDKKEKYVKLTYSDEKTECFLYENYKR